LWQGSCNLCGMCRAGRCHLLFLVFLLVLVRIDRSILCEPKNTSSGTRVTVDNQFIRSGEIRNRIELQNGESVFFAADIRSKNEVEYQAIGVSSPYLRAGPLALKGLLREIFNPLAYGPGSSVFQERPEIRLERSFSGSSKTGIVFDPVPDHAECFLFHSSGVTKAGGSLSVPVGSYLETHLLFSTSQPKRETVDDSWFTDRLPFPGDRLIHGATRLALDHPGLFGSLSLGISAGRRIVPGYFTLLDIVMKTEMFQPELSVGISSPRYFTPDGKWCSRGMSLGLVLTFLPFDFIELEGGYTCRLDHPSGWESAMRRYLSSEEKRHALGGLERYDAGFEGIWYLPNDLKITFSPHFEAEIERIGSGRLTRSDTFSVQIRISSPSMAITAEYQQENDLKQAELAVRYQVLPERIELSLGIDQPLYCPYIPDLAFELELMSEIQKIFIRIEQVQGEPLLSLGLETKLRA